MTHSFPKRRSFDLPHFDEKLSSWLKYGKDIMSYFRDQDKFNLIFAPHIRILERISNEDISFIRSLSGYENILADLTSDRLFDMTYTRSADIYVGDVSSQVYEFIYEPDRKSTRLNSSH